MVYEWNNLHGMERETKEEGRLRKVTAMNHPVTEVLGHPSQCLRCEWTRRCTVATWWRPLFVSRMRKFSGC